jgi:GNAT superfamily N-acetyltransferase
MTHVLRPPITVAEWDAYHAIRRRVLFELRGRGNTYDPDHPDEHRPGNHPFLLTRDGLPVGVIRVDLEPERAIFRRVAVRADAQRRGHGRALLSLAEAFVRQQGIAVIHSYVDPDAMGFYERCGFIQCVSIADRSSASATMLMVKHAP